MFLALALAVAATIGVAMAVSGGSASPSSAASPGTASLARAAYVTGQTPGFQFDLTIVASVDGHEVTIDGEGAFDERNREGTATLHVAGQTLAEVIKDPYVYVRLPGGVLAHGKPWIRADLSAFTQEFGNGDPLSGNTASPTQMLSMLKASGDVSAIDQETLRGVATTHYHALVDFKRYATVLAPSERAGMLRYAQALEHLSGSSSLPIDVWIDSESRVRRLSTEVQVCTPEGRLMETISMDLFDYGAQPVVTAPALSEVDDVSGLASSQTPSELAHLGC